jgi:hypothetical protein
MKSQILIIKILIFIALQINGQIEICGDNKSYHPIDKQIFIFKDSLQKEGVDTILVYRHWESVGSFNGYGKVIWSENGNQFQYDVSIQKDVEKNEIINKKRNLENDNLISFYFKNNLNLIIEHPKQTMIGFPQDASHFVKIIYSDKEYCFEIEGLDIKFGEKNLRAEWVKLLTDKEPCLVKIDGEMVHPKIISKSKNRR